MLCVRVSWLFQRHPRNPGMSSRRFEMSQFFISPDFIFKSQHNVCSVHIAALMRIYPMFGRNKQPRGRCARCDEEYLDYKRGQMSANPIEAV